MTNTFIYMKQQTPLDCKFDPDLLSSITNWIAFIYMKQQTPLDSIVVLLCHLQTTIRAQPCVFPETHWNAPIADHHESTTLCVPGNTLKCSNCVLFHRPIQSSIWNSKPLLIATLTPTCLSSITNWITLIYMKQQTPLDCDFDPDLFVINYNLDRCVFVSFADHHSSTTLCFPGNVLKCSNCRPSWEHNLVFSRKCIEMFQLLITSLTNTFIYMKQQTPLDCDFEYIQQRNPNTFTDFVFLSCLSHWQICHSLITTRGIVVSRRHTLQYQGNSITHGN